MYSCQHCQYKSGMDSKHSKVHSVFEMFYSKQREKCIHVDTANTNPECIQSILKVYLIFEMLYSKQREKCIHVDTANTNPEWIQSIQRFIWYSKCSTQNRENTFTLTLSRYWMNHLHVDTVDMRLIQYSKCSTHNRENSFMSTLSRYWMNHLHVDTVNMRLIWYSKCSTQNRVCRHCRYMLHAACNEISFHCMC